MNKSSDSVSCLNLTDVAQVIEGDVVRDASFDSIGMFRNRGDNMLSIYYDERFKGQLIENSDRIKAVITTKELSDSIPQNMGVIVSKDPMSAFLNLHMYFCNTLQSFYTIERDTYISPEAIVHSTADIACKNVSIGAGTIIEQNVVIKANTSIGSNTTVGPGVAIGGEGFEMREIDGKIVYVPHAGGVQIGDDVQIFANTCIAKSIFGGVTYIGNNCKIDHLVHIAHASAIGNNCRLVAGSSVGGATVLGDNVWVGPNAVIANSLTIGDGAWIALGSAVVRDVPSETRVASTFARPLPN